VKLKRRRIGGVGTLGHRMASLTRNQIELLKELKAAGEHGRRIHLAPISRAEVEHLIAMQYIKRLWHRMMFVITERGREALETSDDR
jgi:hypothetical protein